MKLMVFGVLDVKVGAFGHPFFASAFGQAVRMFGDWVNDASTPLHRHPEDYELFHVGSFDDVSGELVPLGDEHAGRSKTYLARGTDFVEGGPMVAERARPQEVKRGA